MILVDNLALTRLNLLTICLYKIFKYISNKHTLLDVLRM